MIKIYQKTIRDRNLRLIAAPKIGSWIYVEDPSEDEIQFLTNKLFLKESLLRDALDPNEVPRMEIEKGSIYVFTRIPYGGADNIYTAPLLIIISERLLVTLSPKPLPFLDDFLGGKVAFSTTQKTKLLLQLFSRLVASYNQFLTDISRRVRRLGIRLEEITNKEIAQLVAFEGVLNDFLSALVPTNTILGNLLSSKFLKLYEEDKELIEDLILSIGQLVEICKSNLKTMVNIRESYSTIMTNNLNRVIKLLTALTVILAVPTMIASFFGMNVALPGAGSPHAFVWILGFTVLIAGLLLLVFIRNRWL